MATAKNTATETVNKLAEQNQESLMKVKNTLKEAFANVKKIVGFDNAPEFVRETVEANETLASNWFDSLIRVAQVKSVEELNEVLNTQVKHFQKNITTAMDLDFWKKSSKKGAEWKAADYMNADFAKETVLKVIELCQPAK
jgi:lipopolysaccharide biosynthesis regulator YciM